MITIILVTLLVCYLCRNELRESFIMLPFVGLFLGLFISEGLYSLICIDKSQHQTISESRSDIHSLNGINGVNGSFMFGTGTIENKPVYYFTYLTGDNEYKVSMLEGDITFKFDSPKQPYISTIEYKSKATEYLDSFFVKYFLTDYVVDTYTKYIVHLPNNSIPQSYSVLPN